MKLNFAIFALSLVLFSGLRAMEEKPKTPMPEKTVSIRCSDGRIIGIAKDKAFCASFIRNYVNDCDDRLIPVEGKEGSHDALTVDFSNNTFFSGVDENDETVSLDLSADTLKKMFDCCIHEEAIQRLNKEEILAVFEAGHFLGIARATLSALTLHAQNIVPYKEQPKLIQLSHYVNSIGGLYNSGMLKIECQLKDQRDDNNGFDLVTLFIKNQHIETLDGIELLAKKYEYDNQYVTRLVITGNNLKILHVSKLLAVFPFLKEVHADDNDIEKLIVPQQLPPKFMLFLNNNKLQELPQFKLGEDGHIDLQNNPLSARAKKIMACAVRPSFLQNNRHRQKALLNADTLKKGALSGGFICAEMGIAIPYLGLLHMYVSPAPSFVLEMFASKRHAIIMGGLASILGATGIGLAQGYFRNYPNAVAQHKYQQATFFVDQKSENS